MLSTLLSKFSKPQHWVDKFPHLAANVLEVRNLNYLKSAMNWKINPVLEGEHLDSFQYLEDLNDRRIRDAEVIGVACCNGAPEILLEIGTSHGQTTALMAKNAPSGMVHTINIPPEEIADGGRNVTFAPSLEQIGSYYRAAGLTNITQIYANTANWEPDFGPIDVVFIDGCHDSSFVFNDTVKILRQCRPGSVVMWHDFNPGLSRVYEWIGEVCLGVEQLYSEGIIQGRILQVQDSWIGVYKVPSE